MKVFLQHVLFGHASRLKVVKAMRIAARHLNLPEKQIMQNFHNEMRLICNHHVSLSIDAPAQGHLEFCSALLSAYRQLLPVLDNDKEKTINYLGEIIYAEFNTRSMSVILNLILFFCRNNPDRLRGIFSWLMNQYGASFVWSTPHHDRQEKCSFQVTVRRCFYVEFFKAHELRELTTVLCKIDSLWYEKIDPEKHGFIFNKAGYQTQGFGAKTCEFPIEQIRVVDQSERI